MNRTAKNRPTPYAPPVVKAPLSDKNVRLRFILVILLIFVAICAFGYALMSLLSEESGWITIEADTAAEMNCSDDFVFQYAVGASGASATVESKAITSLYTDAMVNAYRLFNNDENFEGVNNIFYINQHPNEVITVEEVLYNAFSLMERYDSRYLYLAPVYAEYDNLFASNNDTEAWNYDPYQNEALKAYAAQIAAYAQDKDAVSIELLGNNQIMLNVSEEYMAFADENELADFVDFFWMKNAFIVDYIADLMADNNYTLGSITSFDGFTRNLDNSGTSYSYNLFDRNGQTVYPAGVMQYTGAKSIVYLRNYRMTELDNKFYYETEEGEIRTAYTDLADGLSKTSINNLVSYSKKAGCAEILIQMMPVYIADSFAQHGISSMKKGDIYSIFCEDSVICYNDEELILSDLYDKEGVQYTIKLEE